MHTGVDIFHIQCSAFHGFHNLVDEVWRARLDKVVSGRQTFVSLEECAPVGHHYALEAPFVAEDIRKQVIAAVGVLSIDLVIGTHDSPWLRFLHSYLEGLEVNLPCSSLRHYGVRTETAGLLVVEGKVFERSANTVILDTADVRGRDVSAENRVFGKIFEIPPAERVPLDVVSRSQDHVYPVFKDLVAHGFRNTADHILIPGGGQARPYRKPGTVISLTVIVAFGEDAQTGRAVGHYCRRYSQPGNRIGIAHCPGNVSVGMADLCPVGLLVGRQFSD